MERYSGLVVPKDGPVTAKNRGSYFVGQMIVLITTTAYVDVDALKGALIVNFLTFAYLFPDHSLTLKQTANPLISGFNTILFPLTLVIPAFALKQVNDDLHLAQYVLNITIPIIIPLSQALGANVCMAVSVVVSAGAVWSKAGFYSDATILSAASTNCPTMTHTLTQLPYTMITLAGSTIL